MEVLHIVVLLTQYHDHGDAHILYDICSAQHE
jgi:hypothetical protein